MDQKIDEHGQTWNLMFNRKQRRDRSVDELIGVCKGMAADEVVNQAEAEALLKWLEANREITDEWPANMIYGRVCEMLVDGMLDQDEQDELLNLLTALGGPIAPGPAPENLSTSLPFDIPHPEILFESRVFCFTGKMVSGTRAECQSLVSEMGGIIAPRPTKQTHYLVIGDIGSRDWVHSSYGRKIEHAVTLRDKGCPLAIVPEQHWAQAAYIR